MRYVLCLELFLIKRQFVLSSFFIGSSISKNGIISVNSKLKVAGFDSVYAIGDVNNINEEKMAYTAKLHANLVFNNMVNEIEGSPLSDYVTGLFSVNLFKIK